MKVAVVFMEYPHHQLTFAASDLEALRINGIGITTIALRGKSFSEDETFLDIMNIRMLKNVASLFLEKSTYSYLAKLFSSSNPGFGYLATFYVALRSLVAFVWIKSLQVDLVHLFWGHYPSILGLLLKEKQADFPVTMFLGAYDMERTPELTKRMVQSADLIFTHSQFGRRRINEIYGENREAIVVNRGIDLDKFQFIRTPRLSANFVYSGRLIRSKRVDLVIEWFKTFKMIEPGATLRILGEGPEYDSLRMIVDNYKLSDCIYFSGHVDSKQVGLALSEAQYLLFCSSKRGEVLPNAVKEAMACGCVCVVNWHPSIEELITDGINGFLVNEYALSEDKARSILAANAQCITDNARETVVSRFDRSKTISEQIYYWNIMLNEKASLKNSSN